MIFCKRYVKIYLGSISIHKTYVKIYLGAAASRHWALGLEPASTSKAAHTL